MHGLGQGLRKVKFRNAGLDEAQAGIKIARRNINNLRYANDTTLMLPLHIHTHSLINMYLGHPPALPRDDGFFLVCC